MPWLSAMPESAYDDLDEAAALASGVRQRHAELFESVHHSAARESESALQSSWSMRSSQPESNYGSPPVDEYNEVNDIHAELFGSVASSAIVTEADPDFVNELWDSEEEPT